ncbi:MAG: GNAT family N-acetyltransferase [Herpetosiphonaceae bacterium]|nr:GNAT family N-acetyltransferase [Herpetosiphonaceae bacterium]
MTQLALQPLTVVDREWVEQFVTAQWGAPIVVGHGVVYRPHELPGFIATEDGARIGLVTYTIAGTDCEIVTLDNIMQDSGVGAALISAVKRVAQEAGCRRLWLITTNDNLHALRFYQKRGFVLAALHRNAVVQARLLKPSIPQIGNDGIPIRDELELEMELEA